MANYVNVHNVYNHQKLLTEMSSKHLNRISIVNGRIAQIFGADQTFFIETDDINGQIFLKASKEINEPQTITIVCENGFTQDMEIDLKDIKSQTLLLRLPDTEDDSENNNLTKNLRDQSIEMMKRFFTNNMSRYALIKKSYNKKHKYCDMKFVKGFSSHTLDLFIYKLKNERKENINLLEKDFCESDVLAVYIEKNLLLSKEETQIIIVKRRKEVFK